jgi:hypothetical protein
MPIAASRWRSTNRLWVRKNGELRISLFGAYLREPRSAPFGTLGGCVKAAIIAITHSVP